MRGHLRQRGDGWELRVYAGKDPVSGPERYVTKTIKGCGKREAERALNEFVVAAGRGTLARTRATVGELLDAWFDDARADFSPRTVRETAGFIERDLRPALGHLPLARLSAAILDSFYAELRSGRKRSVLSPATIRRLHGIVRRALAQGSFGSAPTSPRRRRRRGAYLSRRWWPCHRATWVVLWRSPIATTPTSVCSSYSRRVLVPVAPARRAATSFAAGLGVLLHGSMTVRRKFADRNSCWR